MSPVSAYYQEARILFPPCANLYEVYQHLAIIVNHFPEIAYSPIGSPGCFDGAILRAPKGAKFPDAIEPMDQMIAEGETCLARGGFRLGTHGESETEIAEIWANVMAASGFKSDPENTLIVRLVMRFPAWGAYPAIRLPYWMIASSLRVEHADKAAETLARGVGEDLALGFGMILPA